MDSGAAETRPIVAHVRSEFLPLSETFIYRFITAATRTAPVVLTGMRSNETAFPLASVIVAPPIRSLNPRRLAAAILRRSGAAPWAAASTHAFAKAIRRLRPEVVHAHFGPDGVTVANACRRLGIPLVVSFYGYDASTLTRNARWERAYQRLFATTTAVIALSEDFRERLERVGCPPEKIHIVRLGIDLSQFPFREPSYCASGAIRLCGISRLVEKKGTEYALRAVAELRKQFPDVTYMHIGDGPLLHHMRGLAADLGITSAVDFRGAQSNDVVRKTMNESDIYLQPSVTAADGDQEGTPVAILEAMAIGLPVVSTFHSGIPEMICHGVDGLLAPERDTHALAANLMRLIESPSEGKRLASAARMAVEERYDVTTETAKLEAIYLAASRGDMRLAGETVCT